MEKDLSLPWRTIRDVCGVSGTYVLKTVTDGSKFRREMGKDRHDVTYPVKWRDPELKKSTFYPDYSHGQSILRTGRSTTDTLRPGDLEGLEPKEQSRYTYNYYYDIVGVTQPLISSCLCVAFTYRATDHVSHPNNSRITTILTIIRSSPRPCLVSLDTNTNTKSR